MLITTGHLYMKQTAISFELLYTITLILTPTNNISEERKRKSPIYSPHEIQFSFFSSRTGKQRSSHTGWCLNYRDSKCSLRFNTGWLWLGQGLTGKNIKLKLKQKTKTKLEYDLKKCAPMIRSMDLVFSPTRLRSIVEVFVANMQWAGHTFSISLNSFCFRGTFSTTAYKNEFLSLLSVQR